MSDHEAQSSVPPHPSEGSRDLAASLLDAEPRPAAGEAAGWAYPTAGQILIAIFVAYHAAVLIVHNLPTSGLSRGLVTGFEQRLAAANYLGATGSTQLWAMFAPNPVQQNIFIRVLVDDGSGALHDLEHDIYGRRSHPYLFYEHMGKVNQRLAESPSHRRAYGAWICREWERDHGGEPARAVHLVRLSTRVPIPQELAETGTFDPSELPLRQETLDVLPCATTPWAQLPPRLRERYGFAPAAPGTFRSGPIRTWVSRRAPQERNTQEPDPLEDTP